MHIFSTITLALFTKAVVSEFSFEDLEDFRPYLPRTRDDVCQPSRLGMKEYNGFRIQHQIIQRYPNIHHTRISQCANDEVIGWDAYAPSSQGDDLNWGKKFCQVGADGKSICFIIARRKKMARLHTSLFARGSWIGGIFKCPGHMDDDSFECRNNNALPLYPLYPDDPIFTWIEAPDTRHLITRMPMIVSQSQDNKLAPDFYRRLAKHNWYKEIDINEKYDYSDDERGHLRHAYDFLFSHLSSFAHIPFRMYFATSASLSIDKGDGVIRRPVFKRPDRKLYESQLWESENVHPAPLRDENAQPISEEELKAADAKYDLEQNEPTLDMLLSPQLQFEFLVKLMREVEYKEWEALTLKLDTLFSKVERIVPYYYHPPPPQNVTEYLQNLL